MVLLGTKNFKGINMTIIKKKIKYSKTKYQAYSLLNDVAHSFIESTGGYVAPFTNHVLQSSEMLGFLLSKNLQDKSITVFIRYSGTLLGTFVLKNEVWKGYRYNEELKSSFLKEVKGSLIPKLDRSVSDLINYKLYDNVTQFRVSIDEYQLSYTKYGRGGSIIDVADSDRYLRGRGNYSI